MARVTKLAVAVATVLAVGMAAGAAVAQSGWLRPDLPG